MQVVFLGGASAIGASCLAVEIGDQWLVIDAGVRVGGTGDPLPDLSLLQDKNIAAILVTHAHADHIGALPLLHAAFPATPIYATRATGLLMEIMLADALRIMSRRATEELEIPLYRDDQVAAMLEWLRPIPINQPTQLPELPQATITATLAGHVAGAVAYSIEAPDGRLVVSGDISATIQRTVPGATIPPLAHPDLLILESTYGRMALHPNRQAEELRVTEKVTSIIAGGGHCLVPCFALGRAQELLLILNSAQGAQQIPRFPIYVDGLVRRVTTAYMQIPEMLNPRLARAIRRGRLPFGGSTVTYVRDVHHREQILAGPPACIITSSGMLTGGPSAWFAERLVDDEKAAILITGYVDEDSPGRRLLALAETPGGTLTFGEQTKTVRCAVHKYALSAHADASELTSFVTALRPAAVALVHGDGEARHALAAHLTQTTIHLPTEGQRIDVQAARHRLRPLHPDAGPVAPATSVGEHPADEAPTTADLVRLHTQIRASEPERVSITTRELAALWYATPTERDESALAHSMTDLPHLFVPVMDLAGVYHLGGADGISEQFAPDLVGQLLLVRFGPDYLAPALCLEVSPMGLQIITARGSRGWRRILPAAVLEVLGGYLQGAALDTVPDALKDLEKRAQAWRKHITRADLVAAMTADRSYSLDELAMLLGTLREDVSQRLAVAHMLNDTPGIVRSAAAWDEWGGPARYSLHPDQLVMPPPEPGSSAVTAYANTAALSMAIDQIFGEVDDLYRRGFDPATGDISLYFHFPAWARQHYAAQLAQLATTTGVTISVSPHPHQGALAEIARDLVPGGLRIVQAPSLRFDEQTVVVQVEGVAAAAAITEAQNTFQDATAWTLRIVVAGAPHAAPQSKPPRPTVPRTPVRATAKSTQRAPGSDLITLSRTYVPDSNGVIRRYVKPTGEVVLVADFPDAARVAWGPQLDQLRQISGAVVEVGGTTSQLKLTQAARLAAPVTVQTAKSISVYADQKRVQVRYTGTASTADWEAAQARFLAQTGWDLMPEKLAIPELPPRGADEPALDQARAIAYVKAQLGPAISVLKVSADSATQRLTLRIAFPDRLNDQARAEIAALADATGWDIVIHPQAHPLALEAAARALVPPSTRITMKKITLDAENQLVTLTYRGVWDEAQQSSAQHDFLAQTGWHIFFVAD